MRGPRGDAREACRMYVREVQKTLALPDVETEDSKVHGRLVQLVESHRAVMVIFMQARRCDTSPPMMVHRHQRSYAT